MRAMEPYWNNQKDETMKKKLSILSLSAVVILSVAVSCTEREELRTGIDDLNGRLDELLLQTGQLNETLSNCTGIINGSITITGYSENEYGDYTITFSSGQSMTVYSGVIEEEMPVITIGEDGWIYSKDGETHPLLGPDGSPVPVTGGTPQVRVSDNGRWEYSFDGETWMQGFGSALPSAGSVFDDVVETEKGLQFTWHSGDVTYTKEVALYGGLALEIEYGQEVLPLTFTAGETKTLPVTQTAVEHIAVETLSWGVRISEDEINITAPESADETDIIIKIFSKEGYCRLVTVPVKSE